MLKLYFYIFLILVTSSQLNSAWKKCTNIPASYSNVVYLDVFFLPSNPQYGWTCGYEGKILRTTNGGKSWLGSRILNNQGTDINAQLESIQFVSETIGFTSGPENSTGVGVIFKTTDGGASWFNVTPNNAEDLWGTYFLNENVGLVIGGGCGGNPQYFWRTENGGQSWVATIYYINNSKMADAILFSEDGLGYAVSSGKLWKSVNGGKTWIPISTTGSTDWHEEISISGLTFLIPYSEGCYGNTTNDYGGVRITHDEGKSWTQFSTGVPMFGSFLIDRNRGWAAGFNRTVIYTNDGGKSWSTENCGIESGASMDDIWFINDTTGWVVGRGIYEYFVPYANPPEITVSGGRTICEGDTVTLSASEGYDSYLWSNGETSRTIKVYKQGSYAVRGVIDSVCYNGLSDYINISFFPKTVPEFEQSSSGDPCQGDTVTITLKGEHLVYEWSDGSSNSFIKLFKSGEISVKIIDSNGCEAFGSYTVNFQPNPEPVIQARGRLSFCMGDSVLLSTTNQYFNYNWYKNGSSQLISTNSEIWVKETGGYFVIVFNQSGCEGNSDTINVIVRNETNALQFSFSEPDKFDLDSAYYNQLLCRMMKISNIGANEIILNDTYIFRNLAFSTPQSQFPISIPAGTEISLKVCFSPDRLGINLDTLLIGDVCSDHIIVLTGFGLSEGFEGISKCEVPLVFELKNLYGKTFSFGLGSAAPNPAADQTIIKFSAAGSDNFSNDINIRFFNSIGQNIKSDYLVQINSTFDDIKNGEIIINTSELIPGLYVIALEIYGEIITGKFTVFR